VQETDLPYFLKLNYRYAVKLQSLFKSV